MSNSFTPGPWHACHDGKCRCKQVWGKDHPVATITHGKWGDDYPSMRIVGPSVDRKAEAYMEQLTYGEISEELAQANACLIAHAPDYHEHAYNLAMLILQSNLYQSNPEVKLEVDNVLAIYAKVKGRKKP